MPGKMGGDIAVVNLFVNIFENPEKYSGSGNILKVRKAKGAEDGEVQPHILALGDNSNCSLPPLDITY